MKRLKLFSIVFIILICIFSFTGCQSTNQAESYFNYSKFEQASFEYDEETNQTKVVFSATLTNNTIYNFNSFSIKIGLYKDSNFVGNEVYKYDLGVKNGDIYTGDFNFNANGKVDSIKYVSWTANYDSLWKTYKWWFIVSIILVVLSAFAYLVIMVIEDLDLSDMFDGISDFLEDHSWFLIILLLSLGGSVWAIISSYWVPTLIIVGMFVVFFIFCLVAHFIKYIIEVIFGNSNDVRTKEKCKETNTGEYKFDNKLENVSDYIKSPEKLSLFTIQQLKNFCKMNNIIGYSNLSKSELISLIASSDCKGVNAQNQMIKSNTLEELDNLIGLEGVKEQLKRIRAILLKNKNFKEKLNLHMCFYGNPGTGKTLVARIMANIFYEVGVLPTNKLVETDRSGICGQYVGQTAPLTHKKVKEAMGGVLFIDEAYALCSNSGVDDYGNEAIAALLKDMEDYKGKFCVILAGYKNEMEKMIALNPGFDSRINRKIEFPDYSIDELMKIFDVMIKKKNYEITDDAKNKLLEVFEIKSKDKSFANARTVRNILDSLVEIQAVRTINDENSEINSERIIRIEDVEQYLKEL